MSAVRSHPGPAGMERDDAGPFVTVLTRIEIAIVPLATVAAGAFGVAIGQLLQPGGPESSSLADAVIVPGGILIGTIAAGDAVLMRTALGKRLASKFWLYQVKAAILLIALSVVAILDRATATVALTSALPMAAYFGLIFPRVWSRISIAAVLIAIIGIHLLHPDFGLFDTAIIVALAAAGWVVGLIPRQGHRYGYRQAELLSRSDGLTGCLNRRGFIEQLSHDLQHATFRQPTALLVLDLDDFKRVNDHLGHAAGDDLLRWVGEVLPPLLPAGAAFGRLGGDEFAFLVPNTGALPAVGLGERLRGALTERITATCGVSSTADGTTHPDALLEAAEHALRLAKADPSVKVRHRATARTHPVAPGSYPPPVVSYESLRARGGPPATTDEGAIAFDGRWMLAGFTLLAGIGALVVLATSLTGNDTIFADIVRYLGLPWVIAILGLGVAYRNHQQTTATPLLLPFYASATLTGIGVIFAALATDAGMASPIIGALFLKVLFDASTFDRRFSIQQFGIVAACWIGGLLLGPADALWAAPFQGALLIGSYALGSIGRVRFEAATYGRLVLANTDELTGLLNRRGFEASAQRLVARAAAGDSPFAVITIDLEGFREVNENHGMAAGDRTLQSVAGVLLDSLPGALAAGRVGGDEFMAAIPAGNPGELEGHLLHLEAQLRTVNPGVVGEAVYGADGVSLDVLMRVADRRAYRSKQQAKTERLRNLRGRPRRPGCEPPSHTD